MHRKNGNEDAMGEAGRTAVGRFIHPVLSFGVLLTLIWVSGCAHASNGHAERKVEGPYFYHDSGYGTDAYAGPFDVLLNKGLAVAQWEGRGRDLFSYPYGWEAVDRSLRYPGHAVDQHGGWGEVLLNHLVPFYSNEWRAAQWAPNYFGHVLEGGVTHRRLTEWYQARGVPLSALWSGLTVYSASVLNEAYENTTGLDWAKRHGQSGTVMDLYFFDPLGILLFQSDAVSRFFSHAAGVALWPTQGSIVLPEALVMNNSNHLVFKLPLFFTDRASLFAKTGLGLEVGFTLHRHHGIDVSLGVGRESREQFLGAELHVEKIRTGWSGGVWVDRNNVLLASLLLDEHTDRRLALNVYPGVAPLGGLKLGAWFVLDYNGRPFIGVTGSRTMGLGFGLGF
jgi:hypothetical protein